MDVALVSGTLALSSGTAAAGGITSALQTTERETAIGNEGIYVSYLIS